MAPPDFPDSPLLAHVKRLWIHGFLAGLAVVLVILSLWYFIWGWPLGSAPEGQEEAKPNFPRLRLLRAPAATSQVGGTLKDELEAVLAKLAEANQKKDLPQLLSLYDPAFPDLQQKTEEISRTWKIYDYRSLRFRIEEIRSQSPGNASAKVIWEAETRNRSTYEIKDLNKTYLVWFTNDSGQWRIKSLEKAGTPGEQEKPDEALEKFQWPSCSCTLMLALAGACAAPPPPAPGGDYYLTSDMTYLRDAAGFDSHVVGQLYKGDQVERLDISESGWWRVRSGRTGQAGWVPSELLSPNPVPVVYFYVTQTVSLRECPKEFCPSLQMLSRGDQVQKVEQNDQGWWRVLVAQSRNLGWLPAKVLAETSGKAPGQGAGTAILFCGGETPDAAPGAAAQRRSHQAAAI